jgi:hypothetical protein
MGEYLRPCAQAAEHADPLPAQCLRDQSRGRRSQLCEVTALRVPNPKTGYLRPCAQAAEHADPLPTQVSEFRIESSRARVQG